MPWYAGIFAYIMIWWLVLFAVLPWGVKAPEHPEPGHAPSAPTNPHMLARVVATSIVAAILWAVFYYLVRTGVLSLRPPGY
jgi:predicted secreted protein